MTRIRAIAALFLPPVLFTFAYYCVPFTRSLANTSFHKKAEVQFQANFSLSVSIIRFLNESYEKRN